MQLNWCVGDVFDTNSEEDIIIKDLVLSKNLAWPQDTSEENHTDSVSYDDLWRDIIPSQIISGPHFLAHEVDKLDQVLQQQHQHWHSICVIDIMPVCVS